MSSFKLGRSRLEVKYGRSITKSPGAFINIGSDSGFALTTLSSTSQTGAFTLGSDLAVSFAAEFLPDLKRKLLRR